AQPAAGNVISGQEVHRFRADGIFSDLSNVRKALTSGDQGAITRAAEGLQAAYDRVVRIRSYTGARVQEIESRTERLADQEVVTAKLLSELEDTDFNDAILRFQMLQTSLQAAMQTTAKTINLSLMDFIG